jgi:hypothetical protein
MEKVSALLRYDVVGQVSTPVGAMSKLMKSQLRYRMNHPEIGINILDYTF